MNSRINSFGDNLCNHPVTLDDMCISCMHRFCDPKSKDSNIRIVNSEESYLTTKDHVFQEFLKGTPESIKDIIMYSLIIGADVIVDGRRQILDHIDECTNDKSKSYLNLKTLSINKNMNSILANKTFNLNLVEDYPSIIADERHDKLLRDSGINVKYQGNLAVMIQKDSKFTVEYYEDQILGLTVNYNTLIRLY